jgi:glycosyltransferase involved in cell wall biosynthesis
VRQTVVLIRPPAGAAAWHGELTQAGFEVVELDAPVHPAQMPRAIRDAVRLRLRRRIDCVVTVSPRTAALTTGHLLRALGVPWIAQLDSTPPWRAGGRWWRAFHPRARTLQRASLVITRDARDAERLHREIGASVATIAPGGARLADHVRALVRGPADGGLRILMLGTLNTPHVEHLALAMRDRGHDVRVAGDVTPAYPPSKLPDAGVPASVIAVPAILTLRRLLRELRPDVVHAHWLYGFAFLAALARARPLVAMAWGSDVLAASPRQLRNCRYALRHSDLAMTDSAALVGRLVELGADPSRTELVNWGVDLKRFTPAEDRAAIRSRLGLGSGPVVLSPRALTPVYNPATVLDAFERASSRVPGLQLVLKHIGAEPQGLDRPLPEGARVVGHVPYEQMPDWYRAADIVVSIPSSDSSPRTVWEAMACGAPCVLSDLPWVRELIKPGRHALVVPVDAAAVADAIVAGVSEPERAESLAREGRALVERTRDSRHEMDRLSDIYRRLAER